MEARLYWLAAIAAAISCLGASYRTANFIVSAPTPECAKEIGQAAEQYRKQLAIEWLGQEMPSWAQPCPITAHVADHLGAGGATSFLFERGEVFGWRMTIQGSRTRILDSVLPHEVTHTIFATHFRQPLPRWADEGACTTVEHPSEKAKQQAMLVEFLRTNRGISFSKMFAMREYPSDVMPLYSQGYSLARFLIQQGGKRKFLAYVADGLSDGNWTRATKDNYSFTTLGTLQNSWLDWVRRGSPAMDNAPVALAKSRALAKNDRRPPPEPNLIYRGQSDDGETSALRAARELKTTVFENAGPAQSRSRSSASKGWHPPAKATAIRELADASGSRRSESREPAADDSTEYQVTRPQPLQQSRQIILEWSRPNGASAGNDAAAGNGASERDSVYQR